MKPRYSAIFAAVLSFPLATAHAQTPAQPPQSTAGSETALPTRRVVLFSSGVGYFERAGEVNGASSIPLSFRVAQVNDVLKSLVIFDGAGGVRPVTFATKDSLQRQLAQGNFSLDASQSLGQLLRQFRGARVRIRNGNETIEGQIISVSIKTLNPVVPLPVDDAPVIAPRYPIPVEPVQVEVLNLLTATGLRALRLDAVEDIQLLDGALNRQLQESLNLTAAGFDDSKRTVNLNFDGRGRRNVRAAYLLEAPVWKTSYRLVLDDKGVEKPYLQGWGLVENTTDDDWNAVSLSLVSGRPISFIQDLYQPLYVGRPVVAPQVIGSPNPQLYGEAVDEDSEEKRLVAAPARSAASARGDARDRTSFAVGSPMADSAMASESFAARSENSPVNAQTLAQTAAQAQGGVRGELFEYAIKTPVTLAKNQAAMVPIIGENIGGEAISIFNPAASQYALRGFRLRNTSSLRLAGGPLTVFQSGTYAGDAQIGEIGPGEDRLISYAVDLELVPAVNEPTFRADILSLSAKSGVLIVTRKQVRTLNYAFRNKAAKARKIYVQLPIEADFKVIEPKTNVEKTATEYRFEVTAAPGKTTNFKVVTERPISETVGLIDLDFNVLIDYARNAEASPALKAALQGLVAQRRKIGDLQNTRAVKQKELDAIDAEQNRIRQNMQQLDRNSDLYKQYVAKLTAQEARVDALRVQIAQLREDETVAQNQLRTTIDTLTIAGK